MQLNNIRILDFRNYASVRLSDFKSVNLLIGPNGSGKTNFLEAVFMLFQFHPLRTAALSELVRWKENAFYIGGDIDGDLSETGFSPQKKILKLNGEPKALHEFRKTHFAVAFLPEDLSAVTGTPDERRTFIDRAFSALDAAYQEVLYRYQRALRQRNAQLKIDASNVSIWDEELVRYGSMLLEKRLSFINQMNPSFSRLYGMLYGMEAQIRYRNTFRIEGSISAAFKKALGETRIGEREKGYTLAGPHRDNFEIVSLDKTARVFASQGQKRALALALRWSLLECFEKMLGVKPILLLDDVLLELDANRRKMILEKTLNGYQAFLTATSSSTFAGIGSEAAWYEVAEGSIRICEKSDLP